MKILKLSVLLFLFSGCTTTKLVFSNKWERSSKPSYVDYFDYYWFGLSGSSEINLQKVCLDQRPHAFIKQKSAEDITITFFTLGIYTPTTVKVWCGE